MGENGRVSLYEERGKPPREPLLMNNPQQILSKLNSKCEVVGVVCHAFLVSWYNDKVSAGFCLPYDGDSLAVLIVSTPSMFEHLFLPYLQSDNHTHLQLDPLDQCLKDLFSELKLLFPNNNIECMYDFEINPTNRKPRILVQTAGHVSGVARYYQRGDLNPDPWPETKKVYGVSMHPVYGGWFAFRGVLIFKDVRAPDLEWVEPVDCVPTQDMRMELLEKYNLRWKDWTFRDVIVGVVKERYSKEQRMYFETEPGKRAELIDAIFRS